MEGWIKIYRSIREHWLWKDPVKLKWWLDLLLEANFAKSKAKVNTFICDCDRGQIVTTLSILAKRWNTSKDNVRNFLKVLEREKMVLHESYTKFTRITICKYEAYQDDLHEDYTKVTRSIYREEDKEDNISHNNARGFSEISLEDCYNELSGNQQWQERVTMNMRSSGYPTFTLEDFRNHLLNFFKKLSNEGETEKAPKDAMSHFARWLTIELKKQKDEHDRRSNTTKQDANNAAMQQFLDYYEAANGDSRIPN